MPLEPNTPLTKTELGREAIARRLPELPPRLRPALIMMDGKRTVAELSRLADAMGGQAAVAQLLDLGLAEPVAGAAQGALSPAPPPLAAQVNGDGSATPLSLEQFRTQLADYFEAQLGPSAQMLAIQIRACQQVRDLKPLIARGTDNLQHFKGLAAVKAFQQGLGSQVPAA
jgi:hypothetical protein